MFDHEGNLLEPYSKAPLEVLHNADLKDFSKLLYFEMYSLYEQNKGKNDYIFPKNDTLAEKLGVKLPTIKKALKDLEDNGFIKRKTVEFVKNTSRLRHIYFKPLSKNESGKASYVEFPKSLYFADLTSLQKIIMIELLSLDELFADENEAIDPSNQGLGVSLGKSKLTIMRNLQTLEDEHYLTIKRFAHNQRHIWIERSKLFHVSNDLL